jgi:NitT/TauT family transport system substrate-binding protein
LLAASADQGQHPGQQASLAGMPSRRLRVTRTARVTRVPAAAAGVLALLLITGCGGPGSPGPAAAGGPEKTHLVIGAVPAVGSAGLFIAQDRDLFGRAGLRVTIKPITDPTTAIPALLHGSMDAVFGQWTSYIAADAAGVAHLHAIASGQALGPHSHELLVPPNSNITTPAQLKGKTIGIQALGGLDAMLVSSLLAEYGIRPSQVHLVAVPFPEMGAALAAHRVAAVESAEPFVTQVEGTGAVGLADLDQGATQIFPVAGYAVTDQWLARYPRTAAALARALRQAQGIAATDLAAVQRAVVQDTHVTAEVAGSRPWAPSRPP